MSSNQVSLEVAYTPKPLWRRREGRSLSRHRRGPRLKPGGKGNFLQSAGYEQPDKRALSKNFCQASERVSLISGVSGESPAASWLPSSAISKNSPHSRHSMYVVASSCATTFLRACWQEFFKPPPCLHHTLADVRGKAGNPPDFGIVTVIGWFPTNSTAGR